MRGRERSHFSKIFFPSTFSYFSRLLDHVPLSFSFGAPVPISNSCTSPRVHFNKKFNSTNRDLYQYIYFFFHKLAIKCRNIFPFPHPTPPTHLLFLFSFFYWQLIIWVSNNDFYHFNFLLVVISVLQGWSKLALFLLKY